ncbi:hypothetical protein BDN72DRAFT_830396 [Pluteus cervinus]|uniref:Uncharacterized protein n=1 Tax=Pluteus cervinus TaxID=181527 RepID=A0ACD3BJ73_9AGAR|nr:hypothetical protein BDN72DRAFT_830396 [Pluteus cervinus]
MDQQARPEFHGRHPPSQYSDSTSAYNQSLHPQGTVHDSDNASAFLRSPIHSGHSTYSPRSYSVHTDDLAMSMLDLGDNSRSSYASSIDRDTESNYADPSFPPNDDTNEDEELNSRMNLGPRMRFHSPAPWEVDDATQEVESSKNPHQRSPGRGLAGAAGKMFHLRTPSTSSRPSVDSARSQDARQSMETTASSQVSYPRGALYALAQESLSRTSVDSASSSIRRKFSRPKFPFVQSRPPNTTSAARPLKSNPEGPRSHNDDSVHPYANPDLVKTYPSAGKPPPALFAAPARPNLIIPDLPEPTSPALSNPGTPRSVYGHESPRLPISDTGIKSNVSSPQRRQISLPLSVQSTGLGYDVSSVRGGASTLPGWTEKTTPAPFALISLEEAQAQRSRGALSQVPISSEYGAVPFPNPGDSSRSRSPTNSISSANRARSLSSSSKAKPRNAFQSMVGLAKPERRDSEPAAVQAIANAPKGLKHKKSGFMRLFNGAREKEEHPPLPPISDPSLYSVSPKSSAPPSPGIPSPTSSYYPATPSTIRPLPSPNQPSRKPVPSLSINTLSMAHSLRGPISVIADPQDCQSTLSVPVWSRDSFPQSAPANVADFPSLKLRPVSALFTAQLADQMGLESRPSLEPDLDTPRSSSPVAVTSPLTPSSSSRFDTDHGTHVRSVEDKFVSAKLAWQRQIWELEGQVRDLRAEIEELRKGNDKAGYCDVCRRGSPPHQRDIDQRQQSTPNVSSPLSQARTGTSSRFGGGAS